MECFFGMDLYVCGLLKENLQKRLTDDKGRDQFLILAGFDLEISWNDPIQLRPEVVHHLHERIEGYARTRWSPLGTYLAAVNKQGVTLWGGATTFECLAHCAHPEVLPFLVLLFSSSLLI
ncbi:eukaryotic translation initiation factor 3 subunit B-like [Pistacia vera]|uniref:eukaryotic translation initiation factor 3 subunit B-like n=1 Tax=Pistacia vera TaxID=55513 RepID=UPI001262B124|nr:eukaryotic translation initiation factor 3 subunit B-like [Pistacia vera]